MQLTKAIRCIGSRSLKWTSQYTHHPVSGTSQDSLHPRRTTSTTPMSIVRNELISEYSQSQTGDLPSALSTTTCTPPTRSLSRLLLVTIPVNPHATELLSVIETADDDSQPPDHGRAALRPGTCATYHSDVSLEKMVGHITANLLDQRPLSFHSYFRAFLTPFQLVTSLLLTTDMKTCPYLYSCHDAPFLFFFLGTPFARHPPHAARRSFPAEIERSWSS